MNNLFINPSKTHYILFYTKQCRQESNLKIIIKYTEILNVKSTNILGVATDSVLSWNAHTEITAAELAVIYL
jgi:hypothetical protein